ncbi:DNA-binding domain-containing protein [Salmonella enterica subsp. enterica serovar Nottingham]|nr:hypothetical protein [Salmonella enterica subsp. enterica serovar Nottingham]ELB6365368.1 TraI domain-containing protein [Salmonella enterica]ECB1784132.1 hypothetical protein [Salmonella enterica subsp. enterica serovar Nottingham]EDX6894428.1 hypothetical protein [Salmonella enterica subsp. enterica serovar Nottingham]EHG5807845.1 DNA-binding domain-containing protein [Salmonella enterica subsp. enterica serovar Nottingham]
MWHKVRKILTGSSLNLPGRLSSPVAHQFQDTLSQRGYIEPQSATSLLETENRQHLLRQLWENSLLPRAQYEQYFLTPLRTSVSLMQQLPATDAGHHAVPGGMIDYTLKTVVFATRLSRGYMLPPGASAEEQSAQSAAWGAVVFYSALFHSLSSLRQIEGELLDGEIWYPGINVPPQPYRFRFRTTITNGAAEGLCTMLGMRLLPGEVIQWLSKTPHALDSLLSFIRGDFGNACVIFQIVTDAIRHAGGKSKGIQDELAVCESVNIPATVTENAQVDGAESADGASLSPAVRLPEPVTGSLTSALNADIPLTPVVDTSLPGDDKAVHEVMSLIGFSPTPVAEKISAEQTATTPCTDESQNTPSLVSAPGEPDQALLQATAMAMSNISQAASDDSEISEGYGQQILSWLSEQIFSGTLTVNNKDSQIHIVGGLVFLPTPHIFFSFMKEKNYPPELKNDIQREFERQGGHFMQKGKGVFSCVKYESEKRQGRYEKISGYLIKSKLVYASHVIPADSAYLFVSNRNHSGNAT